MNSYTRQSNATLLDLQRQRFEVLLEHSTSTAYHPGRLSTFLKQLGQTLVTWLTEGSTLKITKRVQGGADVWQVYDPVANRTLHFDHEDALRIWIEQRYYQQ